MTDPVDRSVLDALVGRLGERGPAFRRSLVATWAGEAETRRAGLQQVVDEGDAEALARLTHALRSAAGALGAGPLSALCAEVEDACTEGGCDVAVLAGRVRVELDRADAALQALAAE